MTTIHRLLDEAFAGVPVTAESQDLKEELRANLLARAAELEEGGVSADKASQKAFAELGDVDSLVAPLRDDAGRTPSVAETYLAHRVRPRPAFVLRTVVLSGVIASAIALAVLAATGVIAWGVGTQLALLLVGAAVPTGVLTADAVHQETASNYPVSRGRAAAYGVASGFGVAGLAMAVAIADDPSRSWPYAVGVPLFAVFALAIIYLSVTQTNRRKAWVRDLEKRALRGGEAGVEHAEAFAGNPAAAARFGMYAGTLWVAAIIVFIVLVIAANVLWALLAIGAAILGTMLLLARMGYRSSSRD